MRALTRVILPGVLAIFSCAAVYAQSDGPSLFKSNCEMCHGADGKSDTPTGKAFKAPDLHSAAVVHMTDDQLMKVISDGKGNMPAFGHRLTPTEIKSLIAYIHKLQHN